ncbi:MAG: twin-arginine translocation signal domain-containing protein, partial [Chromatiaceae bacterium]|nr:twin-arginine translocation signal domain-containing protein [Chromatiaceae bacterium]
MKTTGEWLEKEIGPRISDQLDIGGIDRRSFIKFAASMTVAMGLPVGMSGRVMAAIEEESARPAVIWLHFQECTGCTESLLRSTHPTLETLILDMVSLDYSETLLAGAGHQAEAALHESMERNDGRFILV